MYKSFCIIPTMQSVLLIDDVSQADVLMRPGRAELLRRLVEPRSCSQIADELGSTSQRVYYHVKALEGAGLATKVSETQVRGFREAAYQAVAQSYWLSPRLVQLSGGPRVTRDRMSRNYLLNLAEELHIEVGRLGARIDETPTVGLSAHVSLADPTRRGEFLTDLQTAIQQLAAKYGGPASDETYRLVLACYPISKGEINV
ncbi:MAG: ArsR family transcriptional regulator [Anaerolinea sp.]|nr:ArsR family transcriptional regulator [Anaerolinea sp.]